MALPAEYRLLSPFFVEREIAGRTFKFYPSSVRVAARMANTLSELSGHVSVLMTNTQRDTGSVHEEVSDADGMTVKKTSVQPINPDLAEKRVDARAKAVKAAMAQLTSSTNRMILGELLMDSLRDDFDRGAKRETADVQELVDGMEIPILIEFLGGLVAANSKVFGDLGNSLKAALGDAVGGMFANLAPGEAPAEAGEISKTPS